jgi:hypothetical protein
MDTEDMFNLTEQKSIALSARNFRRRPLFTLTGQQEQHKMNIALSPVRSALSTSAMYM